MVTQVILVKLNEYPTKKNPNIKIVNMRQGLVGKRVSIRVSKEIRMGNISEYTSYMKLLKKNINKI